MLEVQDIHTNYGESYILQGLSLRLGQGQVVAVLGRNGVGKTTLIRSIIGFTPPRRGRILLRGEDITHRAPHEIARRGVGLVPQGRRIFASLGVDEHLEIGQRAGNGAGWSFDRVLELFPRLTVLDSVLLAVQGLDPVRFTLHRPREAYGHLRERAESLLAEWGLADRCHAVTGRLSYGEQRQVELILALAGAPTVLLLDEPTAGLSPAETASVAEMIRRFSRDTTILLIEHDMDVALELVDRVTVLFQGRVLAEGSKDKIRSDPEVAAIYLGTDDA